jgi:hypothetical protein
MARSTCKGGLDAGGSWSPGTAHFVVHAFTCPLLWSKGCTNVSLPRLLCARIRRSRLPVHALCDSGHSRRDHDRGERRLRSIVKCDAALPLPRLFRWSKFGKTPRGDGRVCTDGDDIAIWRFEVISLKGISVPYTSVVQVQGDVAQFHLDALDDLALGGSREGVPAVREDLLRYSETSRLVRSGWPTSEMPTSARSSSPQRVSRLVPSPGSLGGPSCVRSSGLTRPLWLGAPHLLERAQTEGEECRSEASWEVTVTGAGGRSKRFGLCC